MRIFFFSSRRRHTRFDCDWSSDVCSSDLPMVVAYRVSAPTAFLLRTMGLVKVRYFSQPNLLAGRRLVPEFFQEQVSGAALGEALLQELEDRSEERRVGKEGGSRWWPYH